MVSLVSTIPTSSILTHPNSLTHHRHSIPSAHTKTISGGSNNTKSLFHFSLCRSVPGVTMFSSDIIINDYCVAASAGATALSIIWFWGQVANRRIFDQKLNRKFVHISIGLVFMLFWPWFSYRPEAAFLAAVIPGVNIIRMLLIGLGILKEEAIVKSMSRNGDYRELLKGPLYYAATITLAAAIYWRTSPIAIAAICNLCAGDGVADIVGRRFGSHKLPYNRNKSFVGSIAMVIAGFLASIGYMHYFSLFGLVHESWEMILGFFIVSLASAIVESLPISTDLDDNLTVPLTSLLVGNLIFSCRFGRFLQC